MKIKKGESYGAFVKRVRTAAKLTQAEFGRKIGYTDRTVWAWENGANVPLYSQRAVDEFAKTIK